MISISIEDPSQVIGRKPDAKLLARVRSFVELNRDALLEYWHSDTMHLTWVSAQPWIPLRADCQLNANQLSLGNDANPWSDSVGNLPPRLQTFVVEGRRCPEQSLR
jgi:hypothetical protein